ncbi:MAG: hypothetical protein M1834_007074 [Cirrosporium novae-zelandiae]|nr:MAG: hypothetical protein M1834_007074 [Cirrosporium novae-zelandiae]
MRKDSVDKVLPGYLADLIRDHDKLEVIMIGGRLYKVVAIELHVPPAFNRINGMTYHKYTNLVAYEDALGRPRIGHLDLSKATISPLAFRSGTAPSTLYEVIEANEEELQSAGDPFPRDNVRMLPPISGRDVLCVGKNYSEHAKEFNASGYDSSDKVDQPSHPVIFTKRATSIIAHGEEILPHSEFTETLDYEGEIGVIIGKPGYRIKEEDALNYVWGYTIINDVTARERQRDHKQFYMGKSADSFCPMGPIAVAARDLPSTLEVVTHINNEQRQRGTTQDLIFSIPTLIKTLSESITLQPGDVLATGTPAGVGFGLKPPTFLQPGDEVSITVTGLGTLKNRVADKSTSNSVLSRIAFSSRIPIQNLEITAGGIGLTKVGPPRKPLFIQTVGSGPTPIIFVHGLGGTTEYFRPLIHACSLEQSYTSYLFDLEGHGLSPTKVTSVLSIQSYVDDLAAVFAHSSYNIKQAIVVGHSMGCLIAGTFASQHPSLVKKLILTGPPSSPRPPAACEDCRKRAAAVRAGGMAAIAEAVIIGGTSAKTKASRALSLSLLRASLMSQNPEGYAKGCTALADTTKDIDTSRLSMPTLVITGREDKASTPEWVEELRGKISDCQTSVLEEVGHWHIYEDVEGVANVVQPFLAA